jgi:hypothetical protein
MCGIAERLYTRRGKREERKDEERSLHYGRDYDRAGDREAQREERSLHCASAKGADAPVGMTY